MARRAAPRPPDARPPLLEARGLGLRLAGREALGGISFALGPGDCVAVMGPPGAGKTRLLDLLSGFIPASAGAVLMNGRPVSRMTAAARTRRGLGRGFRVPALLAGLSVDEHVALAAGGARQATGRRPRPGAALAAVGLAAAADRPASTLGPGGRRRLEFAMLRAMGARVFILDEPTAGIPATEIPAILELVAALRQDGQAGVLVAEREGALLRPLGARVVALSAGRLVDGSHHATHGAEQGKQA